MQFRNRLTTTRERIIATEVRKLELRQARQHGCVLAQPSDCSTGRRVR